MFSTNMFPFHPSCQHTPATAAAALHHGRSCLKPHEPRERGKPPADAASRRILSLTHSSTRPLIHSSTHPTGSKCPPLSHGIITRDQGDTSSIDDGGGLEI
eukprot:GHVU01050518.1.p1 GENE.GHVU01050518.1~~GHVU01050518.1.p1  ORF type:complete len:101 (+),score=6.33 GHVU01050518.1:259-561(+)